MTMSPYLWCQILCASAAFDIKFLCAYSGVCRGRGGWVCVGDRGWVCVGDRGLVVCRGQGVGCVSGTGGWLCVEDRGLGVCRGQGLYGRCPLVHILNGDDVDIVQNNMIFYVILLFFGDFYVFFAYFHRFCRSSVWRSSKNSK